METVGKPGQAGFVKRGGSGVKGASRSSPQLTLPSFSTEEDEEDDDNENDNDNNDNDDDEDEEVDFPKQGNVQHQRQTEQTGKQPRKLIATKNLQLIRAPRRGKSGFAEIARWNATARQGTNNETK